MSSTAKVELENATPATETPIPIQSGPDVEPAPPPDGGYGWICVASCFTINCFTWGIVASYGVYLSHYLSTSTFPSATPRDYAFIGGLNFAVAMLFAPIITFLVRIWGIKPPMLLGVLLFSTGFVTASFASKIWHLYLTQGILIGLGVGLIYVPSISILSQWFSSRRSLANGISAAGSGIGGLACSFGTGGMISHLSLAWSLRITGLVAFVALIIAVLFIRDRNAVIQPTQHPFDIQLLRRTDVLLLLAWAFISMLGYITLLYSLSDFALSISLTQAQSVQMTALLNLGTALGRPFIGVASDKFGRFGVATLLTLICGLSVFGLWIPASAAKSFGVSVVFAIIAGAILGVFWVTIGPLCVEVAGLRELPSLLSLAWLSIVLPTAFSEVIALALRRQGDGRWEYLTVQGFCGACYVVASACLWAVRLAVRRRKLRMSGGEVSAG